MGGGGGGGSSSTEEKNTTVTTNTTTSVGDIGLTGGNAIDAINALEQGAILREQIAADVIKTVVQETGKTYQQLVGGAGVLVQTAAATQKATNDATAAKPAESNDKFIWMAGAALGALALAATLRK